MNYTAYQCTICKRTKSFEKDNKHVRPDHCTITKGCLGRLVMIGETKERQTVTAPSDVTDWYPRGTDKDAAELRAAESVLVSTSQSGVITVAVKSDNPSSLPEQMSLYVEQRKTGNIEFQQFIYKINADNNSLGITTVSGKDSAGRNIRFDQSAIDEGRVTVLVNGVEGIGVTLSKDKISISPMVPNDTVVNVVVFSNRTTEGAILTLSRNKNLIPSLGRGAWSNIDSVIAYDEFGAESSWFLFSTDELGSLISGKISITDNSLNLPMMLLLAQSPFQSTERHLSFVVQQEAINEFNIMHSHGKLSIGTESVTEIFPPLKLTENSYLAEDLFTTSAATDTNQTILISKKILGPV